MPASASWRWRDTSSSPSGPSPAAPADRGVLDHIALLVATVGGLGRVPGAPGTAASAVAVAVVWAAPLSPTGLALYLTALTLAGLWAAHRAERLLGEKDPGAIVVDEVAGMTLAVVPFASRPPLLLVGFVLFRLFDIVKPFPIGVSQRLPGGLGIVVDDLIAGLYALLGVALVGRIAGWL